MLKSVTFLRFSLFVWLEVALLWRDTGLIDVFLELFECVSIVLLLGALNLGLHNEPTCLCHVLWAQLLQSVFYLFRQPERTC